MIRCVFLLLAACSQLPKAKHPIYIDPPGAPVASFWNRWIGCEALEVSYNTADIVVLEEPVKDGRLGGYQKRVIRLYSPGDDASSFLVLAHEMGHALKLAHSDNPRSVMYPRLGFDFLGDYDQFEAWPIVEARYVKELQDRYCR